MSIITVMLSVILALLLWNTPILLLGYVVFTSIVTVATFLLRINLSHMERQLEETLPETERRAYGIKRLLLILLALITFLGLPLFLASVLDPYVWFTLVISFMAGFSFAEILFHLYTRR